MNSATAHTWSALPMDKPMPLLDRRRIIGSQAMLSHVHLQKGCFVPTHAHQNEQFAVILAGTMTFGIGDKNSPGYHELTLNSGQVLHLPSNVPHSALAVSDCLILDVFSPPSEKTGIDRS
ncbi:MAG TPA: cupin domain-containing protein [Phycisphaerales bacterium]|nr:cupin domain-containing protein [Phycisphaerales bacterium]